MPACHKCTQNSRQHSIVGSIPPRHPDQPARRSAPDEPSFTRRIGRIIGLAVHRLPPICRTLTFLVLLPCAADAQWRADRATAAAAGVEDRLGIVVNCQGDNATVNIRQTSRATFGEGSVEVSWDDGTTERYTMQNRAEALIGSSAQAHTLIERLRQHRYGRFRVINDQGAPVEDRIDLRGSATAIGSLPCTAAADPVLTDAEIRRILIRQSLSRYRGNCPCPYNTDRAGRSCGRRSAYSRPGGASPLCYPEDVSDAAVRAYRSR